MLFLLNICNKIRYKYIYIYYYQRENIGLVLHSYRKIELSCASSWAANVIDKLGWEAQRPLDNCWIQKQLKHVMGCAC